MYFIDAFHYRRLYFTLFGQKLKAELLQRLRVLNLEGFDLLSNFFYAFHISISVFWGGDAACRVSTLFSRYFLVETGRASSPQNGLLDDF